jgi:6-pyruvoyltetrahydropterin/6-carboxytetrahydropterin synthase
MYQIDKTINFCYGHRVWTQELEDDFCAEGDNQTKCKHLHGHEGSVRIFLESETLDNGFVTDFKHLGWLKDFIDSYIDHKFIVDVNDPAAHRIIGGDIVERDFVIDTGPPHNERGVTKRTCLQLGDVLVPLSRVNIPLRPTMCDRAEPTVGLYVKPEENPLGGYQKDVVDGFLFIDFVPTSENLAKWLYDIVDEKMKEIDVVTSHIEWWETPKSRSVYFGNK